MQPIYQSTAGKLSIKIYSDREEMGTAAAVQAGNVLCQLLETQNQVSVIFAAAPSQNEFLDALCEQPNIDWHRVDAFHMDEYIGLSASAPQRFGNFLRNHIFDRIPFGNVHYLNGNADDPEKECEAYSVLLKKASPDIVFMGIGENGHIAFNDPAFADFHDKQAVKIVTLDEVSRNQQVHDGCFSTLDDVRKQALTLTIPALTALKHIFCIVPAASKAKAVARTVGGPISEECPASILRESPGAALYLDRDSGASLLSGEVIL